jgi:hypothetical protein
MCDALSSGDGSALGREIWGAGPAVRTAASAESR